MNIHTRIGLMTVALTIWAGTASAADPSADQQLKPPAPYSHAITECDRQAGHPDDPDKVVPGKERPEMDMNAAIAACRADLKNDPTNPRLIYQLARALTYSGHVDEGLPLIEQATRMGYAQAVFVTGYLYLDGAYKAPKNPCRAGELIRESALRGRMAGEVGFPAYVLEGRFKGCAVKQDPAELVRFLEAAKARKPEYYPGLLIDTLLREIKATN
ncbi:MAG: hypothetical protein IT483_05480 [Gammaproteobacteria bacterium]|nr:hypothetical protein [Gammaproteobacteria bacterium]